VVATPPVSAPGPTSPTSSTTTPQAISGGDLLLADAPAYVIAAFHCIAYKHESGGNPTAVNPSSGDGGLYQFNPGTWQAVLERAGITGYPPRAEEATVAQQDTGAYEAWLQDGFQPWTGDGDCWT